MTISFEKQCMIISKSILLTLTMFTLIMIVIPSKEINFANNVACGGSLEEFCFSYMLFPFVLCVVMILFNGVMLVSNIYGINVLYLDAIVSLIAAPFWFIAWIWPSVSIRFGFLDKQARPRAKDLDPPVNWWVFIAFGFFTVFGQLFDAIFSCTFVLANRNSKLRQPSQREAPVPRPSPVPASMPFPSSQPKSLRVPGSSQKSKE